MSTGILDIQWASSSLDSRITIDYCVLLPRKKPKKAFPFIDVVPIKSKSLGLKSMFAPVGKRVMHPATNSTRMASRLWSCNVLTNWGEPPSIKFEGSKDHLLYLLDNHCSHHISSFSSTICKFCILMFEN